jgi:hypothetical protein
MSDLHQLHSMYENHEERVQRLEDDRVKTASLITEQTVMLRNIMSKVGEQFTDLSQSIRESNSGVTELAKAFQKHVMLEDSRMSKLEDTKRSAEKKTAWFRKIMYAAIIGGGGSVGALILERIVSHFQ